jgi:predicted permease
VLLIGCVNVSSLLLARAAARRKEMAIRAALGGGRPRIVRQLLTESVVLALGGGLVALAVAALGVRFLIRMGPPEIPRLSTAGFDGTVLLFAAALTTATGMLFGLAPAIRVARADLQRTLREGARGSSTGAGRDRLRGLLVVAEIGVSVVLIVGAGLFVRSAWRLQQIPLGFSTANGAMARLSLPAARYSSDEAVTTAYRGMLEQLRSQPAVLRAGASTGIPMNGGGTDVSLTIEGRTLSPGAMPSPQFHMATDAYFETIGMPLRRGRSFEESDMLPGAARVVVVNQKAADTIWPGENPVGKRVSCCTQEIEWREVIGVVGNARSFGQFAPIQMEMFVPYTQAPPLGWTAFQRSMALVVRTSAIADAPNALRRSVRSIDPSLPLFAVQTLDQVVAISTDSRRFNMLLLSLLAATGLALAAVGIYGVVVYFVTQRTAEIGLRLALGATAGNVIRMVLRQATFLAIAGIGGGVVAAIAGTRVLKSLLFEISPTDPPTYLAGAIILLMVAVVASMLPALRATRIDPVRSLAGF